MNTSPNHRTGKTPALLLILDGWGQREAAADNAIHAADSPVWDRLWATCPHTLVDASGHAVGLPGGQMGNSEVGHANIGAGRVVYQSLTRIDKDIADGGFQSECGLAPGCYCCGKSRQCPAHPGAAVAGGDS